MARWSLQLQDLDITIVHRSGRLHSDADVLSCHPIDPPEPETDPIMLFSTSLAQAPGQDLADGQKSSSWWREIIAGLEEESPSSRVRKLCRNFEIRNGVLHHRIILRGKSFYRLCLPPERVEQVLTACHDEASAGHLGVDRTLDKIGRRFFWPKMRQQILNHIRTCDSCQRRKRVPGQKVGLLKSIVVDQPFEKVGLDLIGLFPPSKSGNRFVIIAVDYLTKWVIAQSIPRAGTKEVEDFLVKRVVLQHGAPLAIITDRGKCLTSGFAEKLFRAIQTHHLVTSSYHPQCNGLVERYNHTFADMLSMYVNSKHDNWDDFLDEVTFGYNTSRQQSTAATPFYLLYGRECVLPIDGALGNLPNLSDGAQSCLETHNHSRDCQKNV